LKARRRRETVFVVQRFFLFVLFGLGVGFGLVPACSPAKTDPPLNDGVNDVHKACDIRATWTNLASMRCTNCIASAPLPSCNCEVLADFAALCVQQGDARKADPQCTSALDDCVNVCGKDCNCIDGCYATAPSCKQHDAARDGCVADVCTQYCK
jgi:hypothetical protein